MQLPKINKSDACSNTALVGGQNALQVLMLFMTNKTIMHTSNSSNPKATFTGFNLNETEASYVIGWVDEKSPNIKDTPTDI